MSVIAAPSDPLSFRGDSSPRLFDSAGSTLEDLILGAWEDLALEGRAQCPVCREQVLAVDGCAACGSHLS